MSRNYRLQLSTAQVVAVASNNGGKQALEAVREQFAILRAEPYELSTAQVVAIASNDGGKLALEAVRTLFPTLRAAPYELGIAQVVEVACVGGRPALKAMETHMPALREAPYGLSPARVVAIACIGGRLAVEAVRRGLLVKDIRRIRRRRVSEATPPAVVLGPTLQEFVAVLHFFRTHPQPTQAFAEAMTAFDITRRALLRLLGSAGVTEVEAIGGTIPDAAERWQRVLLRLGIRAATDATAPSPDALQGFAESLEHSLMSPESAGQSASEPRRKRPAETAIATGAVRRRREHVVRPPMQWPAQPAWSQHGGKRAARSQTLADGMASTPADLRWGAQTQRTSTRPQHELGLMPVPVMPASAQPGVLDDSEFGLLDPGTPFDVDFATLESELFGPTELLDLDWPLHLLEV